MVPQAQDAKSFFETWFTPWLATGSTASNGNKTITFPIRQGVKFSDGSALTPADVVFSINRSRKNAAGPLSFLDGAITSIEASGSNVVITLSAPWAPIISDISVFANAIIPANFGGKSEKERKVPDGTPPEKLIPIAYFRDASARHWTITPNGDLTTVPRGLSPGAPAIGTGAAIQEAIRLQR